MNIDTRSPPDVPASWASMADQPELSIKVLKAAVQSVDEISGMLLPHQISDTARPYGRHVLLEGDNLEIMLASWTRGKVCAPHDHGGSEGVVKVLQGRARHRIYTIGDDGLNQVREEIAQTGDVMICAKSLVHAMGDDAAELPLVTLHLYTGPVPHMVVYDVLGGRTIKVNGDCGAWVPEPGSGQILETREGIVAVDEML
jgi:predicted metal-dependent enzyme (double-stranded beta helix superfamily)